MKKRTQNVQFILILTALLLIFGTYFYYPSMNKNFSDSEDKVAKQDIPEEFLDDESTTFQNLEYNGFYIDSPFRVKSEKAFILNEEPDVVHMSGMHVILHLNDGRIVNITSDKGRYNKITYDCFFEQNVKATDGDTKIASNNLDLLATENTVVVYNNVFLDYISGSVMADKINYDFETKYFKVSMFDEEKVKIKVIKWVI